MIFYFRTILVFLACFYVSVLSSQIEISEITADGTVELYNFSDTTLDISNYWLCNRPAYDRLSTLDIECGALNLASGESVTLSGFNLDGAGDELGVYLNSNFGSVSGMVDYVIWGNRTGGTREAVAVAAGLWSNGARAGAFASSRSLNRELGEQGVSAYSVGASTICTDEAGETADVCDVDGGMITFTDASLSTAICIDGNPDPLNVVFSVQGNGSRSGYIITDSESNILAVPTQQPFDLEGAGLGTCLIWAVSYDPGFSGASVGNNLSDLEGCFDLSNALTVYRESPDGGTLSLLDGSTTFAQCAGQIVFDVTHTTDAPNLSYWYIITDANNNILDWVNSAESNTIDLSNAPAGVCRVWGWSYRGLDDPIIGQPLSTLMDDDCEEISDDFITVFREIPDGGSVSLLDGSTTYTGTAGNIVFQVQHTTTAPNLSYWYIITDADNNDAILGFVNSAVSNTLDLSGAPAGTCRIWGWNYRGLPDPVIGAPLSTLMDDFCEDVSEGFITVNRLEGESEFYTAILTGTQEPLCPVTSQGYGTIDASLTGNMLRVSGSFDNLEGDFDVTIAGGSHIHFAPVGRNGGVEVILVPTLDSDNRGGSYEAANNTFELTDAQVNYLKNRELYINIHTLFSQSGELRGQLVPTGADAYLQANLSGLNENPAINTTAGGNVLLELRGDQLITYGSFEGISSMVDTSIVGGAHIHLGEPGINGGVEFVLTQAFDSSNMAAVLYPANNTFTLTQEQISQVLNNQNYINIHSFDFPAGELRGQIVDLSTASFIADLSGRNELPAIDVSSFGRVQVDFDAASSSITVSGSFSNLESDLNVELAGGAHIHLGSSTENGPIVFPLVIDVADDNRNGTFSASNNVFQLDESQVNALFNEGYYINVHSLVNVPGELRGQILPLTCRTIATEDCPGVPDGGSLSLLDGSTTFAQCAGQIVFDVTHTTTAPNLSYWYIITDEDNNILDWVNSADSSTINLSNAPAGTCRVWGWNYLGLDDPVIGDPLSTLMDDSCEDVSEGFITVYREIPDGGSVSLLDGSTTFAQCAGQIVFDVMHTTTAPNLSYWYIITDEDNNILDWVNSADSSTINLSSAPAGTCRVWGWNYRGLNDPVVGDPLSTLMDDFCEDVSEGFITVFREIPDGGSVSLLDGSTSYTGTAGNIVLQVQHRTSAPNLSYWYIITDSDNNDAILGFANSAVTNTLDLSGAPAGTCRIWGWNYRGLADPVIGASLSTLMDDFCEDISANFIEVNRLDAVVCNVEAGSLALSDGRTSFQTCAADGQADLFTFKPSNVVGNYRLVVTDANDDIIALPRTNTINVDGMSAGAYSVYILAFDGASGVAVGNNLSDLSGCFDLSNAFVLDRITCDPTCRAPLNLRVEEIRSGIFAVAWDRSPNAQGYQITLGFEDSSSRFNVRLRGTRVLVQTSSSRAIRLQVRALCAGGVYSEFSDYITFASRGRKSAAGINITGERYGEFIISEPSLSVYPNPTADVINLDYENILDDSELQIFDMTGRKVYSSIMSNDSAKESISVGDLPNGIYQVTISNDGQILDQTRFIKTN